MNVGNLTRPVSGYVSALWLLLALLACSPMSVAAEISARVDRAQLSLDETLELRVRVAPQTSATPDFTQLEKQFDILGRTQSSQYRNINGQIEAYTEWQITLAPKTTGQLVIPSFEYEGNYSNAILIDVTQAPSASDTSADVYLELTVDNESPFVQEQVIVSLKLATALPLRIQDGSNLSLADTLLINLDDTQYQKRVGEKLYTIKEWRYALFPQKSGELNIPEQLFTVVTGSDRGWNSPFQYSTGTTKRLRSKPVTLKVRPQPDSFTGQHWLPATQLTLSEVFGDTASEWTVGEPVTRHIIISAQGLTENQIPNLDLQAPDGLKFYKESPERTDQVSAAGLTSTVAEAIAIVPTQAGEITLPEVSVSWWNLETQQMETATLPARTITVKPNPALANNDNNPAAPTTEPPTNADLAKGAATGADAQLTSDRPFPNSSNAESSSLWKWLSLLLVLTNIATLAWLLKRGRSPERLRNSDQAMPQAAPQAQVSLATLESLCGNTMTPDNAAAILHWLDTWSRPLGSETLSKRFAMANQHSLAAQVETLEAMAYGTQINFAGDTQAVISAVRAFDPATHKTITQTESRPLKPLYPTQT